MSLSLFSSRLLALYIGRAPPQVQCQEDIGEANKREQRFILSQQGHWSSDRARERAEKLRETCMRQSSLKLGYQLKPNQGAIKD